MASEVVAAGWAGANLAAAVVAERAAASEGSWAPWGAPAAGAALAGMVAALREAEMAPAEKGRAAVARRRLGQAARHRP